MIGILNWIAYAASFGTSKWEYTKKQTRLCGELLRKFDLISVREESGIGLCHKHFGVKANHVLDPTMLLSTKDYMYLVEKAMLQKVKVRYCAIFWMKRNPKSI